MNPVICLKMETQFLCEEADSEAWCQLRRRPNHRLDSGDRVCCGGLGLTEGKAGSHMLIQGMCRHLHEVHKIYTRSCNIMHVIHLHKVVYSSLTIVCNWNVFKYVAAPVAHLNPRSVPTRGPQAPRGRQENPCMQSHSETHTSTASRKHHIII